MKIERRTIFFSLKIFQNMQKNFYGQAVLINNKGNHQYQLDDEDKVHRLFYV